MLRKAYEKLAGKLSKDPDQFNSECLVDKAARPSEIVNNPKYPWLQSFGFPKFGVTVISDFPGANVKYCELTNYKQSGKFVSLNVWLYGDGEVS